MKFSDADSLLCYRAIEMSWVLLAGTTLSNRHSLTHTASNTVAKML